MTIRDSRYLIVHKMLQIKAHDEILLKASIEEVWKVLIDIPKYQSWWPKVVNLKILKYDPGIIGSEFQANPLGGKSFTCRVTSIISDKKINLEYYSGIYKGLGVWNIEAKDGSVIVSYSVDLEIVDKSIALLSKIIPVPKLHSMIFRSILNGLSNRVTSAILLK